MCEGKYITIGDIKKELDLYPDDMPVEIGIPSKYIHLPTEIDSYKDIDSDQMEFVSIGFRERRK